MTLRDLTCECGERFLLRSSYEEHVKSHDLVQRLRIRQASFDALCGEAADELERLQHGWDRQVADLRSQIERLTAELSESRLENSITVTEYKGLQAERDRLRDEVASLQAGVDTMKPRLASLRAALEKIASGVGWVFDEDAQRIASEALAEGKHD